MSQPESVDKPETGMERLRVVQEELKARGVLDVKFAWAPDVHDHTADDVAGQVADLLGAYMRGECKNVRLYDGAVSASGSNEPVAWRWRIADPTYDGDWLYASSKPTNLKPFTAWVLEPLYDGAAKVRSTNGSSADAKDAARYRWLRHDSGNVKTEEMKSNLMVYQGARMDELIDKQMEPTPVSATQDRK